MNCRLLCILVVFSIGICRASYAQPAANTQLKDIHGHTNLVKYLDSSQWNELFPNRYGQGQNTLSGVKRVDFYSFTAFVKAAEKFPAFLAVGDKRTQKRELAAFLANIAQETSGGWKQAPGGYFKWGLYFIEENGCTNGCPQYSAVNSAYLPVAGKSYHGRGPKQLSWNYNYGQFSEAYFGSKDTLLNDPDLLAHDPVLSFASAIWFWMTAQPPKPSCHNIMVGEWEPTANDSLNGRFPGFGATVNVINGGVECGTKEHTKTKYRYDYYRYFCKYFNVSPGDNIECTTQQPFGK